MRTVWGFAKLRLMLAALVLLYCLEFFLLLYVRYATIQLDREDRRVGALIAKDSLVLSNLLASCSVSQNQDRVRGLASVYLVDYGQFEPFRIFDASQVSEVDFKV